MDENFEIKNEAIKAKLRDMAEYLKSQMPEGWGFTFFMFDHKPKGSIFYVSSAERDGMIKTLEEFIIKQKGA